VVNFKRPFERNILEIFEARKFRYHPEFTCMLTDYYSSDQQLHWLTQTLAKVNRSFVPKASDDSHTNFYFDLAVSRICGRWIENADHKCLLSINLIDQSFELFDKYYNSMWLVSSAGKSIQEVEGQLSSGLEELGFSNQNWNDPMHYDIPNYDLGKGPIERLNEAQIKVWANFRALANYASLDLLGSTQAQSEIRIWPHHFDTGVYFQLSEELGIGFGLAMKDEMAGDAYFYLTAYSDSHEFDYSAFKSDDDWEWKSGEWKGALLKLESIENQSQASALSIINRFSISALEQFTNQFA